MRNRDAVVFKVLRLISLLVFFAALPAQAQYFGKNKVQWEDFDFKVLKTEHFDIYYYPREAEVAADMGRMAERWYTRLSAVFQHQFTRKPIVLYANPADFQQTTTTTGMIGQGTGGFTDQYQNRIVMPITGNYAENDHVLGHEMVHVFQYDLSNTGARTQRRFGLEQLPLWLIEGMAEYLSKGREDPLTAMWIRDATNRNKLPDLRELTSGRYFPYRYGQALLAYIGGVYGDDKVVDLLLGAGVFGLEQAFPRVLGVSHKELFDQWHAANRALYEPTFLRRPATLGEPLLGRKRTRGDLNVGPAVSPDGRWVAFLSTRSFFSIDLYLADAKTGNVVAELVSSDRDAHFESLRFIDSAGSWSPDSKKLAFVTFQEGDNWLAIIDVDSRKVERRIKVPNVEAINNVAWSPDGRTLALSAQVTGASDLFLYDLQSGQVQQLTNDKFAELHPDFSPDGRSLAFVSDRAHGDMLTLKYDDLGIFTIDIATREIKELPLFQVGEQVNPQYGPDGSIYFIANPEGIADVFRYSPRDNSITQLTRVSTGVSGITQLSPALSVAERSGDVFVSVYENDNYNIYHLAQAQPTTAVVATTLGAEAPSAAILPPLRVRAQSVTTYLQQPEEGLPATGLFRTESYRPKLALTYLGPPSFGVGVDRFGYGAGGTISAYFSDVLGEHNVGFTIQGGGGSGSSIDTTIGGELFYINQKNRINWGGTAAHIPYISARTRAGTTVIDDTPVQFIQQERQITLVDEVSAISQYPLSTTRRFEANGGFLHYGFRTELVTQIYDMSGRFLGENIEDGEAPEGLNLFRGAVAYVGDSSTFGFISPLRGTRYRFQTEAMGGDLNFQTALADYRRYFYHRPMTFAVRGLHYGRYGTDAETERLRPLYIGQPSLVRGYDVGDISLSECERTDENSTDCPVFDRLVGSKFAVASAELRIPLFGVGQFGVVSGAFLPTELMVFADGGAAWTEDETPELKYETETRERVPVFSVGVGARILLAYIPLELYMARPFQRPQEDWVFGFNIAPGW